MGYAQENIRKDSIESERSIELNTVDVSAWRATGNNSNYLFNTESVKPLITIMGETDIMRYIGTLPGVSQGMEGGMAYFVRGSNSGNNMVELDGVPVYGNTHLFGLLSTFHPDIIQSASFKTGGIAASNGDFSASLLQLTSLTPDSAVYSGKFNISPFLLGVSATGFIPKTKISFVAAARISLLRYEYLLLKSFVDMDVDINPQVADVFVKANYKTDKNKFQAIAYYSNDYFGFNIDNSNYSSGDANFAMNWSNKLANFSWEHILSPNMRIQTLGYLNSFFSAQQHQMYSYSRSEELETELIMKTALNEQVVKSSLFYENGACVLNSGISIKYRQFSPASEKVLTSQTGSSNYSNPTNTHLYTMFADFKYKYGNLTGDLGARGNYYYVNQNGLWLGDLRAKLLYEFSNKTGLELSYDGMTQTHHILEGLPAGWSHDLMVASDQRFRPEVSNQIYFGGYWENNIIMASAGVYYKDMQNVISYINSTNIFGITNTTWEEEIAVGQGKSYGMEFRAEKKGVRWTGAVSYTLSKTSRQYDEINNGEWFAFKFDRRHILSVVSQLQTIKKKNKGQFLNLSLSYSSGHNTTIPTTMYKGVELPYWSIATLRNPSMNENSYYRQLMSDKNGYKMPDYFRIDIGYSFKKKTKRTTRELTIGVFNVLNRQNSYLVFYDNLDSKWKQLSIFPIIPSISWSIGF